jgi:23S rRNA pseudouridine2605 synthase
MPDTPATFAGDRLAKVIARAGLCSRRDAELWIKEGRVSVNGKPIRTPAFNVTDKDQVKVDGVPLTARQGTRVWLYHKPQGLVVTEKDPEGRPTIFETLAEQGLPRVVSIGRLDINTEGLLLLTNDGGLKRVLELPATGWLRRYRVRAFGSITQKQLDALKDGLEVDGVKYGPIEATLEREQGSNVWMVVGLREGKNREVKNVLGALGLEVNRLIRVSFGPFQLADLPIGAVEVVKARILREQLGKRLAEEAGVDFDSELPEPAAIKLVRKAINPALRAAAPDKEQPRQRKAVADRTDRFRFTDRPDRPREFKPEDAPMRRDRPGSLNPRRPPRPMPEAVKPEGPPRKVFNPDGTETEFVQKLYGKKPPRGDRAERPADGKPPLKKSFGDKPRGDFEGRPKRDFGGRPKRDFDDRPKRLYGPRGEGEDGPKRAYAPRTAEGADRPKRTYTPRKEGEDRPKRAYATRGTSAADRPKRDYGDRPKRPYTPRSAEGTDHPKRDYGDKPKRPYTPRSAEGADRPKRDYGDRPKRDYGDRPKRPYTPRNADAGDGTKRAHTPRPDGGRPKRSFGDKPRTPRAPGDRPFAKRPRPPGPPGDRPPRRPRS